MYDLEDKRNLLWDYIDQLPGEEVDRKPSEDSWSTLEILEHLYLMETFIAKKIEEVIKTGEHQPAEDKPIERTTDRSYKVEAPEALRPRGEFSTLEEAKDALNKTREVTRFLLHNKSEETLQNHSFPHPSFGDMNLEQWAEFIGWHELRHLEQMKEVREKLEQ